MMAGLWLDWSMIKWHTFGQKDQRFPEGSTWSGWCLLAVSQPEEIWAKGKVIVFCQLLLLLLSTYFYPAVSAAPEQQQKLFSLSSCMVRGQEILWRRPRPSSVSQWDGQGIQTVEEQLLSSQSLQRADSLLPREYPISKSNKSYVIYSLSVGSVPVLSLDYDSKVKASYNR